MKYFMLYLRINASKPIVLLLSKAIYFKFNKRPLRHMELFFYYNLPSMNIL